MANFPARFVPDEKRHAVFPDQGHRTHRRLLRFEEGDGVLTRRQDGQLIASSCRRAKQDTAVWQRKQHVASGPGVRQRPSLDLARRGDVPKDVGDPLGLTQHIDFHLVPHRGPRSEPST